MKKIKNLIFRHKILAIVGVIAIVFAGILSYFFLSMFIGGSNNYGNRLDGISEVEISKSDIKGLKNTLEEKNEVSEASVRIQGKIVYINIVFNNDVSLDTAKNIAKDTLNSFDDDEKAYYDFGYFLTQVGSEDENDDKTYFNVTGTKHAKASEISFIKS